MPATVKSAGVAARARPSCHHVADARSCRAGERARNEDRAAVAQAGVGIGARRRRARSATPASWKTFGSMPASATSRGPPSVTRTAGNSRTGWRPGGRWWPRRWGGRSRRRAAGCSGWRGRRAGSSRPSARPSRPRRLGHRAERHDRGQGDHHRARPSGRCGRDRATRLARPSRPCAPKNHSNGRPTTRPSGSSTKAVGDGAAEQERRATEPPAGTARRRARPDRQPTPQRPR